MKLRPRPLLSDIQPTKQKYNAGDKIIAVVTTDLTADQRRRMIYSINKFVGVDVDVLIVNASHTTAILCGHDQPEFALFQPSIKTSESELGVANISLTKVEFKPGDKLFVSTKHLSTEDQRTQILKYFQRWAGDQVEVILNR